MSIGNLDTGLVRAFLGKDSGKDLGSLANRGTVVSGEDISNSTAAWLMDEASGNLVDEIGGLALSQYGANANTYSVPGATGYDPGVTMNPVAGGFRKTASANTALDFGTGDGNVLVVFRSDGALGSFSEIFVTTIREGGWPGWSLRAVTGASQANGTASFTLIATDATTVNASWSTAAVQAAVWDTTAAYVWEFQIDRTAGTIELFLNSVSQGAVSIATLAGKSIDTSASSGIGLCCDYRTGINRNIPVTVFFARVKKLKA